MSAQRTPSQVERAHAFGSRISWLRDEQGLSQKQLGAKINMSGGNLSKIEKGKQGPPPDEVIARLAVALKADRFELMRIAGRAIDRESFEEQVLARLKQLAEQQRSGFQRIEAALEALARD
jgi:transcriptional regulator with XRE-family HTH domain